jgi:periplasmic copper chaperone A
MRKVVRLLGCVGVATGGVLLVAGPASAHIEPEEEEVAAGSSGDLTLVVPHGCDESPTKQLTIQIPESVVEVSPLVHPGWKIEMKEEPLETPITAEDGDEITEHVSEVTFTAARGNELDPHMRDKFTVNFGAPDTPGETLFFKTIQTCVEGETPWIEEFDGEGEEPEHPAPAMTVTEATGGEHGDGEEAEATDDGDAAAPAADESAAASTDDSGSDETGLATAGIVIGVLGLATALFAVLRTRKPSAS